MLQDAVRPRRFAVAAMGTRFELVLAEAAAPGSDPALAAVGEAAMEEILLWHRRLSRFAPDSLVSHINRTAAHAAVRLDRGVFDLLRDALDVCDASDGAFDITLGAPHGSVVLDAAGHTIRFAHADVAVDLGGIAKGHAVDAAVAVLRANGVTTALLHGGTSSIAALGAPPGADGWTVALARLPGAPTVLLRDETLSVSWTASQGGHIVDPRTRALPPDTVCAVTGPSARLGDAWSTAVSVLGRRPRGMGPEWRTQIFTELQEGRTA